MKSGTKDITLDFSNYSLGLNSRESQFGIKDGQAYNGSINARFKAVGFDRAPGFVGLSEIPVFTAYSKGIEHYSRVDGTQKKMGFSEGKLYEVAEDGTKAERYDLTGGGEGFGVSAYDKFFAVNGAGSCVVENGTAYPIGITAPTACTVAAAAGGTLPDGVYTIYVGYALKVDGLNVLYSQGFLCASVTLGSGNNTIAFSNFANSSNTRVNNKVVWMASPTDSATIYRYHETDNNTSTSFSVASAANRNTSQLYRVQALPSAQSPVMTGIILHDDRIYGWKNNSLYASMKATSPYDLERWPGIRYDFPFYILSLFTIGTDLYINTNQGIILLPDGDLSAKYKQITKRLYFKYIRTVAKLDDTTGNENESPVIGWTNDGIRVFSGNGFSIDLSKDVKTDIKRGMDGASSTFQPCGFVYRSKDRSEYRVSYRDTSVNALYNNRQLVLNLDSLTIESNSQYIAAWELWDTGFSHASVDATGTVYMVQSLNGNSQVIKENWDSVANKWTWNDSGYCAVLTPKICKVISKVDLIDIVGRIGCEQLRTLTQLSETAKISVQMGDEFDVKQSANVTPGGGTLALFDEALFDESIFVSEQPVVGLVKLKQSLKGCSAFVAFEQTADDPTMQVISIRIYTNFEQGRFK
jgi:hypothetical protein